MITTVAQRWRERRGVYVPATDLVDPRAYEVARLLSHEEITAFVSMHHYSGSTSQIRYAYGLYCSELVGVAVFGVPMHPAVLANRLPCDALEGVELGRFVLLDEVPGNTESWMLARCFEHLRREGIRGVVSFSDPHPRLSVDRKVIFGGHVGGIYQASNFLYAGQAEANTLRLLPDGRVFPRRLISKIRGREKGWAYSARILEGYGAAPLSAVEDSVAWLEIWLPRLTRADRHPGNLAYCVGLDRATKKALAKKIVAQPYPKFDERRVVVTVREKSMQRAKGAA